MTRDDPARVARALSAFDDIDHELVIGVDSRVPAVDLGELAARAGRLHRFTFREPVDRVRPWLLEQCRGQWIFVLDGDEVVSSALARRLPELLRDGDVHTYHIARRWTFPDIGHWLNETPWWPDFQVRLVRNRPDVPYRQGVLPHEGIASRPPHRYVLEPLYHLDAVVTPFAARVAKAEAYERQRPGLVSAGGGPLNEVFYMPEHHARGRPLPVRAADLDRIHAVMDGGAAATDRGRERFEAPRIVGIPEHEIARWQPPRALLFEGIDVRMVLVDQDLRFAPGEVRALVAVVENVGSAVIPGGDWAPEEFFISYHVTDADGASVDFDGVRTRLPAAVAPGADAVVSIVVRAPLRVGRYRLSFEPVLEDVRWFGVAAKAEVVVGRRFDADR